MYEELTERQRSIILYIRAHQIQYGISPTVREICSHLGLKGPAGVHRILHKLVDKGILLAEKGKKRSWLLASGPPRESIPVLGAIAAGEPIEAITNYEEDLPIDPKMFGCDDGFALVIKGDSMIEAHIIEGDLAIIRPQRTVQSGQIAAVMVEGLLPEATLKIFRKINSRVELHAANSTYKPLIFAGKDREQVRIIGKLMGIVRRP
ncbi:transcriptional repressor LexA [Desulfobacterota bacterium M19]